MPRKATFVPSLEFLLADGQECADPTKIRRGVYAERAGRTEGHCDPAGDAWTPDEGGIAPYGIERADCGHFLRADELRGHCFDRGPLHGVERGEYSGGSE